MMSRICCWLGVICFFLCMSCDAIFSAQPPELKLTPKRIYYFSNGVKLSGGSPEGGYYSGPGVRDNVFYPRETAPNKPDCREYDVEISYSYGSGSTKDTIHVFGFNAVVSTSVCSKCGGTRKIKCPVCHGDPRSVVWTICDECNDNGLLKVKDCSECDGNGKRLLFFKCNYCDGLGVKIQSCTKCGSGRLLPCCPNGAGWVECDSCSLKK